MVRYTLNMTTSGQGPAAAAAQMDGAAQFMLRKLGATAAESLRQHAPTDTLRLQKALTYVEGPMPTATGWELGVGDMSRLGDPNEAAPRGLIKQFLEWYYPTRMWRRKMATWGTTWGGFYARPPKKRRHQWKSIHAWWYLTKKEKAALRTARMQGMFGGEDSAVAARYWWLQETGTYPSPFSRRSAQFVKKTTALLDMTVDAIAKQAFNQYTGGGP